MAGFHPFDILVIVLVIYMTIRGGLSGMASQLLSIASLIMSWYFASQYYDEALHFLPQNDTWSKPVAMLIVFVVTNIVFRIATLFIKRIISVAKLKEFDRQLGAFLGLIKGLVVVLVVTFFAVTLSEKSCSAVAASQSGKYLVGIINELAVLLPDDVRHSVFKEQLAKFKDTADQAGMGKEVIASDVENLKDKLRQTVIDPKAAKITKTETSTQGTGTDNTVYNKQTGTTGTLDKFQNQVSGMFHEFDQLMNKAKSATDTYKAVAEQTMSPDPIGGTFMASNPASNGETHPLAQLTVLPNSGMGSTTSNYPDLDSELVTQIPGAGSLNLGAVSPSAGVSTPSAGVSEKQITPQANLSLSSSGYSGNITFTPFSGNVQTTIQINPDRVTTGSIMTQPNFAPQTVAPRLQ